MNTGTSGSAKTDLYAAIGGAATVEAIVDELYRRLSDDPLVQHRFHPERLATLKAAQRAWFAAALSGAGDLPRDLASAHSELAITDEEVATVLSALMQDLSASPRPRTALRQTMPVGPL